MDWRLNKYNQQTIESNSGQKNIGNFFLLATNPNRLFVSVCGILQIEHIFNDDDDDNKNKKKISYSDS